MSRFRRFALIVFLFSAAAAAQEAKVLPQFHAPVAFAQSDFSSNRMIRSVRVRNVSTNEVDWLQLGCFVVGLDGGISSYLGRQNFFEQPLGPGESMTLDRVRINFEPDNALRVYYFVARVRFQNGGMWNAPLEELKKEVQKKTTGKRRPLAPA